MGNYFRYFLKPDQLARSMAMPLISSTEKSQVVLVSRVTPGSAGFAAAETPDDLFPEVATRKVNPLGATPPFCGA
jgi:hypothetical protein